MSRNLNDLANWLRVETDRKVTSVPVPEWDAEMFVRPISHEQLKRVLAIKDNFEQSIEVVIECACDSGGNPIFQGEGTDWRAILRDKLPSAITKITTAAMEANKSTKASVEELEKN